MPRLSFLGLVPALGLLAAVSTTADQCGEQPSGSRLLAGAAWVTILPEVGGSTAYFDPWRSQAPLALEPGDPGVDPGVFVEGWDVGTLAVGNGYPSSHWVHDELRASACAFKDTEHPEGKTLVLVSVDVYMLFRQDIQEILDKVRLRVGEDAFSKLDILVSATHNHMGPDTAGMEAMNHDYYEYMTDQISSAILMAINKDNLAPAAIKVAVSNHQFGQTDGEAPYISDGTLNSMQVIDTEGDHVIATLMQWTNHPEDTLYFGRNVNATPEQSAYLQSIGECYTEDGVNCHIEGQYLSAGFPGYAAWRVMGETGAPVLFFNGPLGSMITPLDAKVWETQGANGKPVGNGVDIPDGAVLISRNFHKMAVVGDELGARVITDLMDGELVNDPAVMATRKTFFSRLTNWGFRVGLVVRKTGEPIMLGHNRRELFTCPDLGPKDATTCISDNYESELDPLMTVPVRKGNHVQSEAWYAQIGPVGIITMPGEAVVEKIQGLPADFYDDPRNAYYVTDQNRADQVAPRDYVTGGYLRQAMPERYKWTLGLTMDEGGYMVPVSNWRVFCVADEEALGGVEGTCAALHQAGIMSYEDYDGGKWSMAGARCKELMENPEVLQAPPYTDYPNGGTLAWQTCYYGQAFDEADGHYVETNSAGWDFAQDWTSVMKELTGFSGTLQEVNPNFISITQPPI